jgi:hypothetical protein
MKMSLELWKRNGWLREYKTSDQEVADLLTLVERDLTDAAREEISTDWRFNIAYNAGLQLVTIEVESWLKENHPEIYSGE